MTNPNITTSQHLLKRLEEEMNFLSSLMAQAIMVASNLEGTWTSIRITYKNWKRDIER
jgi:hypothetical protein